MMSEKIETIIVAVSGGVDSVALLDMLVNGKLQMVDGKWKDEKPNCQLPNTNYQFIVVHFDHGIREDSADDAVFVENLAKKYGLQFELGHGKLGADSSEAEAREVRYNFLRQCCTKHKASSIMTAHHQDDLIETAIINLLRGTGWRGLAPMVQIPNYKFQTINNHQPPTTKYQILRPLLSATKQELIDYAKKYKLAWREDCTNSNQDFLRNHVRLTLLPAALKADPSFSKKILKLIESTGSLKLQITDEMSELISSYQLPTTNYQIPRYQLIMWPSLVAREAIYTVLVLLDPDWHPDRVQIERVLHFVKTAKPGKQMQVSGQLLVEVNLESASFQFTP